jgi:REP element-mobilizing transposase RayT
MRSCAVGHMPEDRHKHLRRLERVWLESPVYFVTACTHQRHPILAVPVVADILTGEWRAGGQRHGWLVGRYVIMPDHVHFFCAAEPNAKTLSESVRLWKQWTTKRIVAALAKRSAVDVAAVGNPGAVVAAPANRGLVVAPVPSPHGTDALSKRVYSTETARVWQREFFDHVLRSEESYAEKWEYMRQNPVRAGLTPRAEDWPFQGEIHPL